MKKLFFILVAIIAMMATSYAVTIDVSDSLAGSPDKRWIKLHILGAAGTSFFYDVPYGISGVNENNTTPTHVNCSSNDTTILVLLTGLTANTTYKYRGELLGGITAFSSIKEFTTTNCNFSGNVTASLGDTICANTSEILSANTSGTVGTKSYLWNTGSINSSITIKPSVTSSYTVSVTNQGCTQVLKKTITVLSALNITITTDNSSICDGGTANLTANGATSYTWSNGLGNDNPVAVQPTITTTYTVTGSNGSCLNTAKMTVSVSPAPKITKARYFSASHYLDVYGTSLKGTSYVMIGGIQYTPYFTCDTLASFSYVPSLISGQVIVIRTVSDECFDAFTFSTMGVKELNPEAVIIKKGEKISLYDIQGREVKITFAAKDYLNKEYYLINNLFSDIPSGIYFWRKDQIFEKFLR